ncbi:RICIN domain-containing protein [Actinoplanes sp. RD1]|uniref:RICIN domain-containing protein n=1 Tax=Actinoplanes sp. RD1 TaxID=3064538 RepID=UPI002741472A|nr:ricin-type beta-trefoil lectin domain protein [Actinoplanes sp. RD1]
MLIVMLTTIAATLVTGAQPAQAATWSYIVNSESGLCMDNYARTGNIYQYPCNPQRNQWWQWRRPGGATGNQWLIINNENGRCLNTNGGSVGSPLILSVCNDFTPSHRWQWNTWGSQWWLRNNHWNLCVHPTNAGAITPVVLTDCNLTLAKIWIQRDAI